MPASPDEDAPEMVNREQDDEPAQAQTIAAAARQARPLEDSRKAPARDEGDDAQDLVDDEDDELGPGGVEDDEPRGAP